MFLLNSDVILLRECFVGSSNEQGRKKENRKHPPKRNPHSHEKDAQTTTRLQSRHSPSVCQLELVVVVLLLPVLYLHLFVVILLQVVGRVGCLCHGGVEHPDSVRLVGLETAAGDLVGHGVKVWAVRHTLEESTLPFGTLLLFSLAQFALLVLDERLLGRSGVHITTVDGLGDLAPGATRLERILLFDGCDLKRGLGHLLGVVRIDNLLMGILDDKVVAPLALGSVDDVLFATVGVHGGGEGVLLAADPTLAAVVDLASVASG